ncbi:sulfur carrier protein ThiS [Catenovulum maritimum]|uniref:Thiamine biosynthesis protein ThiS n=1 Tax=Catenovulum maritimum TaxID=1513271 RepID=A0A0J8GXF0_9ALTE|nr:sulfur carrier protein ThiS [Catenovulum maritimum]KMT65418.1 thiamine biosynthesis protein ThiS [Catenovulum maritimum]
MNIKINGQLIDTQGEKSLITLVKQFGATAPFALAVNGQFVPKSQHDKYLVDEGDLIDVLSPVQGG